MSDLDPLVVLAERVAQLAAEEHVPCALIGAAALAIHGHARSTADVDLGACVHVLTLQRPKKRLDAEGLRTRIRTPDPLDDLDGVIDVWDSATEPPEGSEFLGVQIINLKSPAANKAIEGAASAAPGSALRCVQLADLVALKLEANGPRDKLDVLEILSLYPHEVAAFREVLKPYEAIAARFERWLAEHAASARRS